MDMLVKVQGLTKQFSKTSTSALKNIDLEIPKGKIVGLVGPDGSGKTTLIRLMAALLTPSEGRIEIEGYDTVQDSEAIHYLTGYMPQKFGPYEDLTVLQNLDLYAHLRNVVGEEKKNRLEKLLQFTNLDRFTSFLAKNLSGGMKQKLGLACALIKKPTLLLLDEPSVGVDPLSRRELWKMVEDLAKEGISIVWSTAYLEEAEKCDLAFLLSEGRLLYSGDPAQLTKQVEGRVFTVSSDEKDRRNLLFALLRDKSVIDGVIQGDLVRVLLKRDCPLPKGYSFQKTAARFEDGFIDILGGGPGGESKLAEKRGLISKEESASIVAEDLTKKFGTFVAVSDVSLKVEKGEIFGLLGPNGAGKTTTFKMLCGLLSPTNGKAFVNNLDLQKAPGKARANIGYMAQKFSLYGNLSVRQNLEFFAGIYGAKKESVEEMIEVFNLQEYLDTASDMLPLGYKQRLGLASANLHHPEILFLDEPTSGVDPITRREFWNHINGLVTKGVTVMITTHFMEEAEYCDRIALVYQSKIIEIGTPATLKNKVKSEKNRNPTLEDAFIQMIENYDRK